MMKRFFTPLFLTCLAASFSLVGCTKSETDAGPKKPNVAFVTNGIASFWVVAQAGAEAAGEEFDVDVAIRMPPEGAADQKRMVEDLVTLGIDGIAISPINPENQGDMLAAAAEKTNLITHDSDAPDSPRLCYIGMDNYSAGRMCGELVKDALPDGGTVMIFVGRMDQLNARLRRQGLIDELLDRSEDSSRFDPVDEELEGDKYTILGTRTDQFDFGQAKAQAEDAIVRYPDLGCMVGLFAYNPPKCLAAIREAGKIGEIQLVAFDEEGETLQGIIDGEIFGTIVQNPYRYGYDSVRVLAGLARGDKSVLPEGGYLDIPARKIRPDNVEEFWTELKKLTGAGDE